MVLYVHARRNYVGWGTSLNINRSDFILSGAPHALGGKSDYSKREHGEPFRE